MSNDFIEMINDIDFSYWFIYEYADLLLICTITIIMI